MNLVGYVQGHAFCWLSEHSQLEDVDSNKFSIHLFSQTILINHFVCWHFEFYASSLLSSSLVKQLRFDQQWQTAILLSPTRMDFRCAFSVRGTMRSSSCFTRNPAKESRVIGQHVQGTPSLGLNLAVC